MGILIQVFTTKSLYSLATAYLSELSSTTPFHKPPHACVVYKL